MKDKDFVNLMNDCKKYLDAEKSFKPNPNQLVNVQRMANIAKSLFPNAKVELKDDPLQLGSIILSIKDYGLDITGEEEIRMFAELIFNAANFEIYSREQEVVSIDLIYDDIFDVTIK